MAELQTNISRRGILTAGVTAAGAATLSATSYGRVFGAGERIGVGLIGFGLMGKKHVETFKKLPGLANLVAIAEVHRGRLAEGQQAMGTKPAMYADFRRLLDDKNVQAVIVATPDHWHALMTMLACDAGKDVYVEKPLTLFVQEGRWLEAVARRTGRVVQVGTQQRSGPHYQKARELLRAGRLGKITSVRMTSVRNIFPGFSTAQDQDPPADLDWEQWLGPSPARPYNQARTLYHFRWYWDYSGGQMTNLGAHGLDIVDWVLGLHELRSVSSIGGRFALKGSGETPDTQDAHFEFPDWSATFCMRECSLGQRSAYGLEFYGTNGCLGIDRRGFRLHADTDSPPVNDIPGVKEGHPVGGPTAVPVREPLKLRTEPLVDSTGDSDGQYLAHALNFLECVRSRQQPISDLASAQRTATACHLANISLRLGRKLTWEAKSASVINDPEAARMLVRPYRPPWDKVARSLGVT